MWGITVFSLFDSDLDELPPGVEWGQRSRVTVTGHEY